MITRSHKAVAATCAAFGFCTVTIAGFNFNTAPAPGGFLHACAGPSMGGSNPWPGSDFTTLFDEPGSVIDEQSFAGLQEITVSAGFVDGDVANSSSGIASLGFVQMLAQNSSPNSAPFPAGLVNGGWSETIVVTSPGLEGQQGYMQFTLNVSGTLFAAGFAGSAGFTVTGYKDNNQLFLNSLFDPGDSDPLSTDRQYGNWAVSTFSGGETASKAVEDTLTFAVPITFGTEFKLGIYARARAGLRSQSGVAGISSSEVDFGGGLSWGGIVAVYHDLTPIDSYTVTGGSGTNWVVPVLVPSIADLNGDGVVDGGDLGALLAAWGTPDGDLNGDGTTDGADLGIVLSEWSD